MQVNKLKLITGLGNPGPSYLHTRHNAGQWFVEAIAERYGIALAADKKFFGLCGSGMIDGHEVRLLVPTTYMNRSGQAVAAISRFFKIEPEQMLVAHDELDFEPGTTRIKKGGGHGGHNGLRDIISALGNNRNFYRLRIGIGHPGDSRQVSDYVLKKAPQSEHDKILASIDEAAAQLPAMLAGDWQNAMHQLHTFKA